MAVVVVHGSLLDLVPGMEAGDLVQLPVLPPAVMNRHVLGGVCLAGNLHQTSNPCLRMAQACLLT